MKIILSLIIFLCCLVTATAQITLNQSDYAISTTARDSAPFKYLKLAGATVPKQGNNQIWDYSMIEDTLPNRTFFLGNGTQPATARPTAFSPANLESNDFYYLRNYSVPIRTYYLLNSAAYDVLGDSLFSAAFSLQSVTGKVTDSISFKGSIRPVSPPLRLYRFPFTINSSWPTTNKTTTDFILYVPNFGINNTPGQQVQTLVSKDSIVGWGILKLRNPSTGGVLSFNVLLQYRQRTTIDSFFLSGQPAPQLLMGTFGLVQGDKNTTTTFRFLGPNFKAPYLTISTDSAVTRVTNIYRAFLPNLGLSSGNKELVNLDIVTQVFPNPTTEGVTLSFNKKSAADWHVLVYDEAGKMMALKPIIAGVGATEYRLNFEMALPNGNYFFNLSDENALIRSVGKIVVVH